MTIYVVKIGGHLNIFATLLVAVQSTDPLFIDRRSPELPIQVLRYMYIVSGIVMQYIAIVL